MSRSLAPSWRRRGYPETGRAGSHNARSSGADEALLVAARQGADHRAPHLLLESIPACGIGDDGGAIERRAQHCRVRDLPAQAAADAGVDHLGHRLAPQRIGIGSKRQRRASGQADAGMIAGAGAEQIPDSKAAAFEPATFRDRYCSGVPV